MRIRIGLDIGGVLRQKGGASATLLRNDDFMRRAAIHGAFDAVWQIVAAFGAEQVFIISKCREEIELKLREWLVRNKFYVVTGFNAANLNFCRERADKTPIAQELGLAHFVDDTPEVLGYMQGIVPHLYLFGPQLDQQEIPGNFTRVLTWEAALAVILPGAVNP